MIVKAVESTALKRLFVVTSNRVFDCQRVRQGVGLVFAFENLRGDLSSWPQLAAFQITILEAGLLFDYGL